MSDAHLCDENEDVRLAATRIRGEFTDDAVARAALESAARSDASAEVRETAGQYVLDDAGRLDDIFRVVRDTSLTDRERLEPIYYPGTFADMPRPRLVVDAATVDVIADLIERSDDAATRRQVLATLGTSESPSFVPILVERLRNDPVPEVRSIAATFLVHHRNLPDVVVALQATAVNDPAAAVRSNAARVLEIESP